MGKLLTRTADKPILHDGPEAIYACNEYAMNHWMSALQGSEVLQEIEWPDLQASNSECHIQAHFLCSCSLKSPNLIDRHNQDDDILDDVWNGIDGESRLHCHARARGIRHPELVNRLALEDGDDDTRNPPCSNGACNYICRDSEPATRKEAQVEAQDRRFDECHCGGIDDFPCHERLHHNGRDRCGLGVVVSEAIVEH